MSNSHAQHGVVVPAWDTVSVKATLKSSMGCHRRGQLFYYKNDLNRNFKIDHAQHLPPLSRQADSSPRAVEQLFVPTRVAVSAGNKRLVNGSCPNRANS